MFDQRLIRKINQGRCFVLVGSGPSTEAGYPSWPKLAKNAYEALQQGKKVSDEASYQKYLKTSQFPELFSQIERDVGGRAELVKLVGSLLVREAGGTHHIYDLLANWPFACYLTTNWDDLIDARLRRIPESYTTIQNTKDDFALIRHDVSHLIVKLHSDLAHPDRAVITSADYAKLVGAEGKYFRDRLRAIFEMFDVLIVGHSLSDPDVKLILQIAKETASPEHPIFMIAADLTKAEESELLERFNIVGLSYSNSDGKHTQLRRLLTLMDKFIKPRKQRIDLTALRYSPEELEAAQAVAVYRRLALGKTDQVQPVTYLGPLIAQALKADGEGCELEQLLRRSPPAGAFAIYVRPTKAGGLLVRHPGRAEAPSGDSSSSHRRCSYFIAAKDFWDGRQDQDALPLRRCVDFLNTI